MPLTTPQSLIIIAVVALGTAITRFLPFILFPDSGKAPGIVTYLGKVLPYAAMGMLVVYCLKDVSLFSGSHGVPELISLGFVIGLHLWRRNTLLSVGAGTVLYMFLVQLVF